MASFKRQPPFRHLLPLVKQTEKLSKYYGWRIRLMTFKVLIMNMFLVGFVLLNL